MSIPYIRMAHEGGLGTERLARNPRKYLSWFRVFGRG
jgi:hypothetical protein